MHKIMYIIFVCELISVLVKKEKLKKNIIYNKIDYFMCVYRKRKK